MSVTASLINMKGGVGKTTLAFNLAWYAAWKAKLCVLAVDLDPQSNLSQYFMGAKKYRKYIEDKKSSVVEIFEQFSTTKAVSGSPTPINPDDFIHRLYEWRNGSLLDIVPSRLELAWTLKNPTEKAHLLSQFLSKISDDYDLILIDCPPTESILTTAAYMSSHYVIIPVRPEFLATIGLPLMGRSIKEFKMNYPDQDLDMAGIIFNCLRRLNKPLAQEESCKAVSALAKRYRWPVFEQAVYYSDSYPAGSRQSDPIFRTNYAREYVKEEFENVANEFLKTVGAI